MLRSGPAGARLARVLGRALGRVLGRTLAAAGVAAAIAGCGNLSLVGSLKQEVPGELRFSPSSAAVPLDTSCQLTVLGGITPYSLVSGTVTALGENTWEFPAQASISGEWQDFPIQVQDYAGRTVTAVVRVYQGLVLNAGELTLPVGAGWTFTVSGGAAPYTWELDGVSQGTGGTYAFLSATAGTYIVDVVDSLGATQAAIVTVVPSSIGVDPLSITPATAVVPPGGQVAFTALGGDGTYTFSAPDGGTFAGGNPAIFTAPGTIGTYTIELADGSGGAPVSAEVVVTANGTLPVLFPRSQTVSVLNQQVQFSTLGGTPPYTYSTNRPAIGSIEANTGLYRQEAAGSVIVTVTDAEGFSANTLVKWQP